MTYFTFWKCSWNLKWIRGPITMLVLYWKVGTLYRPVLTPLAWSQFTGVVASVLSPVCIYPLSLSLSAVAPLQFVITAPAISLLSLSPGSHSEAPGVQFLSVHMYCTGPRWYILAKLVWLWLLPSWVMSPLLSWGCWENWEKTTLDITKQPRSKTWQLWAKMLSS